MISLKNVSYEDKFGNQLLNNVTLEVREGDFISISSRNKNEREMLLRTIGCLQEIKMGELYVDGIELSKYTLGQQVGLKRDKFAYFLEDNMLDENLSVKENLEMPLLFKGCLKAQKEEKILRSLQIVGLTDFINIKTKYLSDWQKNKLAIGMVLVKEAKVVLMVEPLRVLEKDKIEEIVGLLKGLNQDGVTIIVASNELEFAKASKRRIQISDGVLTELKRERKSQENDDNKTKRTKKSTKSNGNKKVKQTKERKKKEVDENANI